ncbi:MAG: hypothetical protein LC650_00665 [Actinobacteria bacterium]|nr:hypothetical protein [Actinomycetota bacterium]
MDPDAALEELREWYNVLQDGNLGDHPNAAQFILETFDDLDNWLISGGFLPRAWRR